MSLKLVLESTQTSDSEQQAAVNNTYQALDAAIKQQIFYKADSLEDIQIVKSEEKTSPPASRNWSYQSIADSWEEKSRTLPEEWQFYPSTPVQDTTKQSKTNMDQFAAKEGLKVVATDSENHAMDKFISDLNSLNRKYNTRYKPFLGVSPDAGHLDEEMINNSITSRKLPVQTVKDEELWQISFTENRKTTRKNFPLNSADDFAGFVKKHQQMYLPEFSLAWLNHILRYGIHAGSIEHPEVMTFLHSLCFFWFEKFYAQYLEDSQIQNLYENHLKYYDYYRSTLQYAREAGDIKQHQALLKMMQQYHLMHPLDSLMPAGNPFFINLENASWFSGVVQGVTKNILWDIASPEETYLKDAPVNVVRSLYTHPGATYRGQVKSSSDTRQLWNIHQMASLKNNPRHPFYGCVANPLNFFHLEHKVIVGDIGKDYSDITYEYGQTRQFNVQASNDWAYGVNWSMAKGFSFSAGSGVTVLGGLGDAGPLRVVDMFFSFNGIKASPDWSTGRQDSESNRRQKSIRGARTIYLTMNHSQFSIRLKDFRRCIVVRPQQLAFENYKNYTIWKPEVSQNFMQQLLFMKAGLMLCSENIHLSESDPPEYILEDYFYIYQPNPGDQGQFQNPLNFRNRPYVITIRGLAELEKLESLFHAFLEPDRQPGVEDYDPKKPMTNLFDRHSRVMDGIRLAVRKAHIWDKTGFYPGVYNVHYDDQHYYFKKPIHKKRGYWEAWGEWLYKKNPLPLIRFDETVPALDK